ncbi:hypothetical protein ACHJH3_08575 [Campylobacter sp. MOP7]|uniref:hypothetical protein n=1 Tax=Campylobacter canis TaxID=3378588 RepID=UPI00387EE83F
MPDQTTQIEAKKTLEERREEFFNAFDVISKEISKLEYADQTKMIKVLNAYLNLDFRLAIEEKRLHCRE